MFSETLADILILFYLWLQIFNPENSSTFISEGNATADALATLTRSSSSDNEGSALGFYGGSDNNQAFWFFGFFSLIMLMEYIFTLLNRSVIMAPFLIGPILFHQKKKTNVGKLPQKMSEKLDPSSTSYLMKG